uniref:choice-of-anchor I family protein n=1 Tax=Luteitalea sp. TaxID=2004800 RepID=UPI0025B88805
ALEVTARFGLGAVGNRVFAAEVATAAEPDPDSTPGNGTANGEDDHAGTAIVVVSPPPVFTLERVGSDATPEGTPPGAGGTVVFRVRRDPASDLRAATVTAHVSPFGVNPIDAPDLVGAFNAVQVEFAAGQSLASFSLQAIPDAVYEADEGLFVSLVQTTFGTVVGTPVTATLLNDDAPAPVNLSATLAHRFDATPAIVNGGGARGLAFDGGFFHVVNVAQGSVDVFRVGPNGQEALAAQFDLVPAIGRPLSVAARSGVVAVTYTALDSIGPGGVAVFDRDATGALVLRGTVLVGVWPDMLRFSPDGAAVYVAVTGVQALAQAPDAPGGVAVVSLTGALDASAVRFIGFSAFDGQEAALRSAGIRVFPGQVPSIDFEPEYIAVDPGTGELLVTLQEANAVGRLNLTSGAWTLLPLGTVDHRVAGQGFDASDRDAGIAIAAWPVRGMRMADGIAAFTAGGRTYFVTANEGQVRDTGVYTDQVRLSNVVLNPGVFPNAAALSNNVNLGRLAVSAIDGDTDGDGLVEEVFSFGSRSFTVFDAGGRVMFESGAQFEQLIADRFASRFNADGAVDAFNPSAPPSVDSRSDNSGPEPESVALATIGGRTFAFIGLERDGGIVVQDVTVPLQPRFVTFIDSRAAGDFGPEDIVVIPAAQSATGQPQVAIAYEYSGTVAVYDLEIGEADLSLDIRLDTTEPQVVAGTDIDVLVRVTNDGSLPARGSVRLTPGVGVSFSGAPQGFDPATGIWTFGPVAAGAFAELAVNTVFATVGAPEVSGEILTSNRPDPDSTPGNGTTNGEDDAAVVSITVAPPLPVVAFNTPNAGSTPEGTGADGRLLFQIVRQGPFLDEPATVRFEVAGGTVSADDVYVLGATRVGAGTLPGSLGAFELTLGIGQFSAGVEVFANGDRVVEPDETVTLQLTAVSGFGVLSTTSPLAASGVFTNDDQPMPVVAFNTPNAGSTPEGTGADGRLLFQIVRQGPFLDEPATVRFEVAGGTVSADDVYVLGATRVGAGTLPGSLGAFELTLGIGQFSAGVEVFANGDRVVEPDETVTLQLTAVSGFGVLSTTSPLAASGVFTNDDVQSPVNRPPVGVNDAVTTAFQTAVVIDVTDNDTDADGDALVAGAFANLVGGVLSLPGDGTVVFTPRTGFTGIGGFTYRPFDGTAQGNVTTVTVEVEPALQGPRLTVQLVGQTTGAGTVTLEVTNVGGRAASNVVIDRLTLRRLQGRGRVLLQTPLPLTIGTLLPGERRTVTVTLAVDPRVQRFAIVTRGQFVNPAGRTRRFSASQTVVP